MKPVIWQVFDWLQTESAYPHGPMPAATCHVKRATPWLTNGPRTLVLGPGSVHELYELKRLGLGSECLVALTACLPEYQAIRADGFKTIDLGDMHDQPYETGSFDLIFSSNVFEHAFSPWGVLLECRRVLDEHGVLYTIVPTFETEGGGNAPWHVSCLSEREWGELHHKCGYRLDMVQKVEEPSVAPGTTYLHMFARAVIPPTPHDEALRRLIALKKEAWRYR